MKLYKYDKFNESAESKPKFKIEGESDEFFEIRRKENNKLYAMLEKFGLDYWIVYSVNLFNSNEEYIISGDVQDIIAVSMSVGNSAVAMTSEEFIAFGEIIKLGYEVSIRVNRVGNIVVHITREILEYNK